MFALLQYLFSYLWRDHEVNYIHLDRNISQAGIASDTLEFVQPRIDRIHFVATIFQVLKYMIAILLGIIGSTDYGKPSLSYEFLDQILHCSPLSLETATEAQPNILSNTKSIIYIGL